MYINDVKNIKNISNNISKYIKWSILKALMELRRKLYTRGSSYETTIPAPLLFSIDKKKKHDVIFSYEPEKNQWSIKIAERKEWNTLQK